MFWVTTIFLTVYVEYWISNILNKEEKVKLHTKKELEESWVKGKRWRWEGGSNWGKRGRRREKRKRRDYEWMANTIPAAIYTLSGDRPTSQLLFLDCQWRHNVPGNLSLKPRTSESRCAMERQLDLLLLLHKQADLWCITNISITILWFYWAFSLTSIFL